eukprot:151582_1
MAASNFRRNMIRQHINEAGSINDLIPMLHLIELSTMQDILKQKVEKMDVVEMSKMFCSSLSIEMTLPKEIIGHITSFDNTRGLELVSKRFSKCYEKKKQQVLQKREDKITSKIQTEGKNPTTFIVDQKRTELDENEIESNYVGPIHNLSEAIDRANDGDIILVHSGTYGNSDDRGVFNIDKRLQIIGIGNVQVIMHDFNLLNDFYFKNIKMKNGSRLKISSGHTLFMDHCIVDIGPIDVTSGAVLDINDCHLRGKNTHIYIDANAEAVHIRDCIFSGCGANPCIQTSNSMEDMLWGSLTLIDNLFQNNDGIPIAPADMEYGAPLHMWVFHEGPEGTIKGNRFIGDIIEVLTQKFHEC